MLFPEGHQEERALRLEQVERRTSGYELTILHLQLRNRRDIEDGDIDGRRSERRKVDFLHHGINYKALIRFIIAGATRIDGDLGVLALTHLSQDLLGDVDIAIIITKTMTVALDALVVAHLRDYVSHLCATLEVHDDIDRLIVLDELITEQREEFLLLACYGFEVINPAPYSYPSFTVTGV